MYVILFITTGGGITPSNLQRILDQTGAQEFHASCRVTLTSQMNHQNTNVLMGASLSAPEFTQKVASAERVRRIKAIAVTSVTNSSVV